MNFSNREKKIFLVALFFVFSYGIYLFGYIPFQGKAQELDADIKKAEKQLRENYRLIRKSSFFNRDFKDILEVFSQKASDEEVMSSILTEIEAVASKIEIDISDKKPQKPRRVNFYNKFTISLSIDGDLSKIMEFVYILQNSPYLFEIDELTLSIKSIRKQDLVCRVILSKSLIP